MLRVRGGFAGIFVSGALVVLTLAASARADAASLIADYRFDDSLASSVPGVSPLDALAQVGPYLPATVDGRSDRVLRFSEGGGLRFPGSAVPDPSSYSTIVSFAFDDVANYRRILAFDTFDADNDNGLYEVDGQISFYDEEESLAPVPSLFDLTFADVAFTRGADNVVTAYTDGVGEIVHPDLTSQSLIRADGLRFFQDNENNEDGSGEVARIRIYDGVLTAAEVADIERTGGLLPNAGSTGKATRIGKRKKPKGVDGAIALTCPPEGVACPLVAEAIATKRGKARKIGALTGEVAPGASSGVSIEFTKPGRKLMAKKGRLKVAVNATVTAPSGTAATATSIGRF